MTGELQPGTVLRLAPGDWRYGDGPLNLRVSRVRHELSRYYGHAWVWVEGHRLAADGSRGAWMQALVRTAALPTGLPPPAPPGQEGG